VYVPSTNDKLDHRQGKVAKIPVSKWQAAFDGLRRSEAGKPHLLAPHVDFE
jgi:hypothetical protein